MEIIAEIGQNHNGDMALAKELIHAAKENGADVAKFQVFEAKSVFSPENNPWYDYNLSTELTQDQVNMLHAECEAVGIEFMASVFDVHRVAWLEQVGMKRYKVASRSVKEPELMARIGSVGNRVLVSLGMWDAPEMPQIDAPGGVDFLYCIAQYPAPFSSLKLGSVDFEKYAGFSDHSLGIEAATIAFSRGARIVEKHFTLDKGMYGPDHEGSMTPDELKALHDFRCSALEIL